MIPSRVLSPLLGLFLMSACGVNAGDACKGSAYTCSSEKEALECRDSVWRALPCRGAAGCAEQGDKVACDMRGNANGDACAASSEGRGLCTQDGKGVLECRMGTLVQVKTCGACTQSNTLVTCAP